MGQEQDNKKRREWKQVSEKERYKIEALTRAKVTVSEIARQLGRDRRTIQREIERGRVQQMTAGWEYVQRYCADTGQRVREERSANRGRGLKIGHCHELARYLEEKIVREKYSPDAALGRIGVEGKKFTVSICTKTLYNYLDMNLFAGMSKADLPVKRKGKRAKKGKRKVALNNPTARSIEERPAEVEERKAPGHWEMDCVESGKGGHGCLLVLTERYSRYELIFKMKAKTQACVEEVLNRLERRNKRFGETFGSITVDNGGEFLAAERLESSSRSAGERRTTLYYAHPYSAWERGSNENQNKLIRRFIPKGADISRYSLRDIRRIQNWMNNYPRRLFNFRTSAEVLAASGVTAPG